MFWMHLKKKLHKSNFFIFFIFFFQKFTKTKQTNKTNNKTKQNKTKAGVPADDVVITGTSTQNVKEEVLVVDFYIIVTEEQIAEGVTFESVNEALGNTTNLVEQINEEFVANSLPVSITSAEVVSEVVEIPSTTPSASASASASVSSSASSSVSVSPTVSATVSISGKHPPK